MAVPKFLKTVILDLTFNFLAVSLAISIPLPTTRISISLTNLLPLWVRVFYSESERKEIDLSLKKVYNLLHSDGSESNINFLNIDAIDYCTFGNSKPFRIKIRNTLNDNFT